MPQTGIERGVTPQPASRLAPVAAGYVYQGDWRYRARFARLSPHLNDWEITFLGDILAGGGLSQRQESKMKAILRKSEGGGQ